MPKKIIQDVIAQVASTEPKEKNHSEVRNDAESGDSKPTIERTAFTPKESILSMPSEEDRINSSPLFQKMKEKRERRGNFSPEFHPSSSSGNGGSRYRYAYLAGGLAVLLALLFAYGAFFGGAHVEVFPKRAEISLVDAPVSVEANGVDFQIMTVSLEHSRELLATGEKYTEKKASGKIVVHNDFDENPQRLVKNTRFESSDGKIYRINESVTVPGKDGGKPGLLEVTVYADLPGEEYNIGETEFTVPGFEGTKRFEKFYAKSKTAMTGGFQGNMKTVSEEDLTAAKQELEASLTEALWQKALAERPEGTVIWKSAAAYEFSHTSTEGEGENVSENAVGTLFVGVFDSYVFSRMIAAPSLGISPEEKVLAKGVENLEVEMKDPGELASGEFALAEILVTGNPEIVWVVDKKKLSEALVGTEKKGYSGVFGKFPEIERARVTITPFWRSRFPDDPKDIVIEVMDGEGEVEGN